MKSIAQLILLTLLLAACAAPPADSPTITRTATPSATPTPALNPDTLTPGTPTITPLPTIPTFTPTFDVRAIVTATPAPRAKCPKENANLKPDFYVPVHPGCFDTDQCIFSGTAEKILDFLNHGGSPKTVITRLKTAIYGDFAEYSFEDVTNDSIPELLFIDFDLAGTLQIFYCDQGQYKLFSSKRENEYFFADRRQTITVRDLNLDGIPEIIFLQGYANWCCMVHTLSWDGATFNDLKSDFWTNTSYIIDVNKKGMPEIVVETETQIYPVGLNRLDKLIYGWNGQSFEIIREEMAAPVYRIQAIYDADWALINGEYPKAFSFYQMVIDNPKLDWWSAERDLYYQTKWEWKFAADEFGLTPTPLPDPTEYPRLAAYAYYRMVILHTFLGEMEAAQVKYATLQEKFPADSPGHPYVEMATDFWNAYQSSELMYNACAAAIAYADAHPEILVPLGSDYHGMQSHTYTPADVCPFR